MSDKAINESKTEQTDQETLAEESEAAYLSDDDDPFYDDDYFDDDNTANPEPAIYLNEEGKPALRDRNVRNSTFYTPEELEERGNYSDAVAKVSLPIHILLMALGRFPLGFATDPKTRIRTFSFNGFHPNSIAFIVVTILSIFSLLVISWNLFVILMELNTGANEIDPNFNYEKAIIQRHFITVIIVWTSLLNIVITSINFLIKRHHFALFLNFWSQSVQSLEMNPAKGLYKLIFQYLIVYLGTTLILVILSVAQASPTIKSAPFVTGLLLFRDTGPSLYTLNITNISNMDQQNKFVNKTLYTVLQDKGNSLSIYTILGGIFLLYVFTWSKVYLLYFAFHCRLLKNAFAQWNGRLFLNVLVGSRRKTSTEDQAAVYSSLFTDHCCLLDLLEAQDYLYTGVVESFFAIETFSICFELYFCLRCFTHGSSRLKAFESTTNYYIRPNDWIPAVIVFLLSIYILLHVCFATAEVGEEANAGIEVVRRKSLVGRKTDEELFFVLSMFSSYTAYRQLQVTGGGYFYFDKEFFIGTLSAIFSYFLITYQFAPSFDYSTAKFPGGPIVGREVFGKLFTAFEGLSPADHYLNSTT